MNFSSYGYHLVNKESKKEENDYEYADSVDNDYYTLYKELYEKKYEIVNKNHKFQDGRMTLECVYSPTFGEPSMTLTCNTETWNSLKATAQKTLKAFDTNYFFIEEYAFIGFDNTNVVTFTCENSVSW